MKAKAILFASAMLIVGCHASGKDAYIPEQHAQSLSSAYGNAQTKDSVLSAHWQDDGTGKITEKDLWDKIRSELKMKVPNNSMVLAQKKKYLKNKSYLHDVMSRAEPYMYWIIEQIEERNMPMELVLLPIVESAFNPHATSATDAAGIWQIMPGTARSYGLKQNRWYDGRRDIVASTTTALDILQRLNRMFDGDWLQTVAAYNSGEGRVLKAIKQNKALGKPTDFWSLSLPKETTIYIPKMLALSDILKNSKRYGFRLPTPNENRALAKINAKQQIQLTRIAEMTGLSITRLKNYNGGYKYGSSGPNGPHYIMVPKSHAEVLRTALSGGEKTIASSTQLVKTKTKRSGVLLYTVRNGDTLSGIANRLGVSIKTLQQVNNLGSGRIKPGQTLNTGLENNAESPDSNSSNNSITYRVRKGDSIASIAKRYRVNTEDLLRWNTILKEAKPIQPGDQLTLFASNDISPGT